MPSINDINIMVELSVDDLARVLLARCGVPLAWVSLELTSQSRPPNSRLKPHGSDTRTHKKHGGKWAHLVTPILKVSHPGPVVTWFSLMLFSIPLEIRSTTSFHSSIRSSAEGPNLRSGLCMSPAHET